MRYTEKPVRVTCAVVGCQQAMYLYQMAETPQWDVRSSGDFTVKNVRATWCRRCDRKRCRKDGGAIRVEIATLREAMCLQSPTGKERTCKTCGESRDESMFPYRLYEDKKWAMRTHKCIMCTATKRRPDTYVTPPPKVDAPYDIAQRLVEKASGKEITTWRQREHDAHCVLMRELTGLPHARIFNNDSHCVNKLDSNTEQLWERKANQVCAWVGWQRPVVPMQAHTTG